MKNPFNPESKSSHHYSIISFSVCYKYREMYVCINIYVTKDTLKNLQSRKLAAIYFPDSMELKQTSILYIWFFFRILIILIYYFSYYLILLVFFFYIFGIGKFFRDLQSNKRKKRDMRKLAQRKLSLPYRRFFVCKYMQ